MIAVSDSPSGLRTDAERVDSGWQDMPSKQEVKFRLEGKVPPGCLYGVVHQLLLYRLRTAHRKIRIYSQTSEKGRPFLTDSVESGNHHQHGHEHWHFVGEKEV